MAFNFNWSPLTADEHFYNRAKDLLTRALNKSPKPPIIVDDILVSDFNLGSVPPDLEILEIGDLAEDRFRGIFKMCYSGDASVTLKTRVQANPMNTYLNSTPSFTSPQPLAASDGLTIPLSITLSHIRLSAFIIVVYSKHKGVTIVFRNDPIESLKVSSTFDSIQFVRDYLQRTIETQLRNLMMDELPSIIHRFSLEVLCHQRLPRAEMEDGEGVIDPLASPPLDPVDSSGNLLDPSEISPLSLSDGEEVQFQFRSLFSNLNLMRLTQVADSHGFLSTFCPGLRDIQLRGADSDSSDHSGASTPPTPSLAKTYSFNGSESTYTFSDTSSASHGQVPSRPSLANLNSGLALGSGRSHSYTARKRKHRVVNLRKSKSETVSEVSSEAGDSTTEGASVTAQSMPEPLTNITIPEESEAEVPAAASTRRTRFDVSSERRPSRTPLTTDLFMTPTSGPAQVTTTPTAPVVEEKVATKQTSQTTPVIESSHRSEKKHQPPQRPPLPLDTPSAVFEQAWIMKMAGEIARRVYDEKNRQPSLWDEREDVPPPYEASR
ncbi:related to Mitochondrial distribution and morphology protein 34 [Cephalotrichum gorgonifer]|uniref:Mitochondrial distribution and morphology protein 34 n=1 Tax=Cephalotrichum gorgonifer TaxID=2041049 RepID=A0AAE8SRR7_9PEZI|nr:related to Mitochondrial distribution and morphology protein 34 [Cephalotrichum gorgonifer]